MSQLESRSPNVGVDMDMETIEAVLYHALRIRVPTFNRDTPPREKVSALEDYLLESAFHGGELEEALFWTTELVAHFKTVIEGLDGYEVALPSKPQARLTEADVNRAKRITHPVPFEAGARARQLNTAVLRQIERLRFEAQWVISRAYTLISGS